MIERAYLQTIKKRIEERRMFIQVVVGPRQVGKTTMITQLLKQIETPYSFESADDIGAANNTWLHQIWDSARIVMKQKSYSEHLIVIDEVQKISNWSEAVKMNWDKDTREGYNIKVILLGSSRLLIQKGLTESLAGRFEKNHIGHWSFSEMEQAFGCTLEEYIYYGAYPGAALLINDEKRWKNYIKESLVETSISKDVLMLTRVDKPALLKRLFELGAGYSGQILSLSKLLGELQDAGNTTTLSHYLSLLSDSGLLRGIHKFSGDVARTRASQPKFQVYNNALFTTQNKESFEMARSNPKLWGRYVESAVGAHLMNSAINENFNLYYWRERNDEVDFVIEQNGVVVGIEIKSGRRGANKGMEVFKEKFHPNRMLIVGTGGIPFNEFFKMKPSELF